MISTLVSVDGARSSGEGSVTFTVRDQLLIHRLYLVRIPGSRRERPNLDRKCDEQAPLESLLGDRHREKQRWPDTRGVDMLGRLDGGEGLTNGRVTASELGLETVQDCVAAVARRRRVGGDVQYADHLGVDALRDHTWLVVDAREVHVPAPIMEEILVGGAGFVVVLSLDGRYCCDQV